MMNIFKLVTRAGRRELVSEVAKAYLTPVEITRLVTDATVKALENGAGKITDERCSQIAIGCQHAGNALIHITGAVTPDSEEGKAVSAGEREIIRADLQIGLESLLTKTAIDAAIDKVVSFVP